MNTIETNNAIRAILSYNHIRLFKIKNNGSNTLILGKIPKRVKDEIRNITNKAKFVFVEKIEL